MMEGRCMKKVYSVFLAIMIIGNVFVGIPVSADATGEWLFARVGETNTDKNIYYSEATSEYKFGGDKSLLSKYPGTPVDGNYIQITQKVQEPLEEGVSYTFSFYARGSLNAYTTVNVSDCFDMNLKDSGWVTSKEVGEDGKNWTRYECMFVCTEQTEGVVSITMTGGTSTILFDNVCLKSETSDNLINDAGFEDYVGELPDYSLEKEDPVYDTNELPVNVLATMMNDAVVVSWRSPGVYTGVKLYSIKEGDFELVNEFPATPYSYVAYPVKNVQQFQVIFSYEDKPDLSYYVYATPSGAWGGYFGGGWEYWYYRGGEENRRCPAKITIDNTNGHDGNCSGRIQSNINRSDGDMGSSVYAEIRQNVQLEKGAKYKVSLWLKAENAADGDVRCRFTHGFFDDGTFTIPQSTGTYDWKYFENYYTAEADTATFRFTVENPATNVWVDDVVIQRVDAENNPYGDNLITNGDFEIFAEESVGGISKVTAVGEEKAVRITWKSPEENYNGLNIYRKYGDEFKNIGYAAPELTELLFTNLENSKTYNYRLVPVNALGIEGDAVEISAQTEIPDKIIENPGLYVGTEKVSCLNGAGSYSIITEVKNNIYDDGIEIDQLVAVYKGNEMISLSSTSKIIKRSALGDDNYKLTTPFKIEDNDYYTVKVFLINNRNDMNLFIRSVEFN